MVKSLFIKLFPSPASNKPMCGIINNRIEVTIMILMIRIEIFLIAVKIKKIPMIDIIKSKVIFIMDMNLV